MNILKWIDKRQHWWKVFVVIMVISVAVVGTIGYHTYRYAPPLCDFVDEQGEIVFTGEQIAAGKEVFHDKALMDHGSYLGDGGLKGPDYTAEALHLTARWMNEYYRERIGDQYPEKQRQTIIRSLVQEELKSNGYQAEGAAASTGRDRPGYLDSGAVVMSPAQVHAFHKLTEYYTQKFGEGGELVEGVFKEGSNERFHPANYITDPSKIESLTAFFYWGGWLAAARRPHVSEPGEFYAYSYTHNWPYDPLAGNLPHGGLVFWSVIGTLTLMLGLGVMLYYYGKMDRDAVLEAQSAKSPPLMTTEAINATRPTSTQRATYKYFSLAAVLFLVQVLAGFSTLLGFVIETAPAWLASPIATFTEWLPSTASRAWHTQISILWIALCWFGACIWVLPLIARPEPAKQRQLTDLLFWMLLVVGVGGAAGIPLAVHGILGEGLWVRWVGIGGWEFMQIARVYHILLYASFCLWLVIVVRGLWPVLRLRRSWSLPNWMVYAIAGMIFMFTASFMAAGSRNFAIGDFWRWCTIHMWVEAFFELFTTIIVAYFLYLMGFVSHMVASRVVYLGAVLFLGSGLIGISHNFYWNAKSLETVALGATFSSLQIAPLVLLTIEAWRFRRMPQTTIARMRRRGEGMATFGVTEAFLFLIAVNFWNFLGAGVLGFMLNLPIVNYYQHGTYLTINHAHAALFGVYGNLAIAAMLFCGRWSIPRERWSPRLLRCSFWSLNIGLALMVVLDLFPVGVHQLMVAMDEGGYAYARSGAYMQDSIFQTYTWLRAPGVTLFVLGGVLPLVYFIVSRGFGLKPVQNAEEEYVVPPTVLALSPAAAAAPAQPAPTSGDDGSAVPVGAALGDDEGPE